MSFNIGALGIAEKPREKGSATVTKTVKAEIDALFELAKESGADTTLEEVAEKLIMLGLAAVKPKSAGNNSETPRRGPKPKETAHVKPDMHVVAQSA